MPTPSGTAFALPQRASLLAHLGPNWYSVVMGLAGLGLAWQRAVPLMGELAGLVSLVIVCLAATVFCALAAATLLRGLRHPEAWAADRRHPVRHHFVAALPISVMLLATAAVEFTGPSWWAESIWWAGSVSLLGVTVWVLSRWWRGHGSSGLAWPGVTPALFIPVVGNVLAPLCGVSLGHATWSAVQFGIGSLFWPVVLVPVASRIVKQGMLPERLLPTTFIFIAPPALIGLSALQFGAPPLLVWALWGLALASLVWAAGQTRRIAALRFGLAHWAMSFPLAALAALTLSLSRPGGLLAVLGPLLLALASLVILALLMATVRGLRDGSLLAPEPIAAIHPVESA